MSDDGSVDRLVDTEPTDEERQRELLVARREELLDHIDHLIRSWELEDLVERAKAGTWGEAASRWW